MFRRYAFAWCFLAAYLAGELWFVALGSHGQAVLTGWATTSVVNLEHEPVVPLLLSAFTEQGDYLAWPVLIALALFGATRAVGNVRAVLICLAGHVAGTLVSEGIVAYRVDAGRLPVSYRHLTDVGPSYVVMSAIVIALICGTWQARIAAGLDLAVMVFIGNVFGGLSQLDVAAVGHLTAAATAAAATGYVLLRRNPAAITTPRVRPRSRSGT